MPEEMRQITEDLTRIQITDPEVYNEASQQWEYELRLSRMDDIDISVNKATPAKKSSTE